MSEVGISRPVVKYFGIVLGCGLTGDFNSPADKGIVPQGPLGALDLTFPTGKVEGFELEETVGF